MLSLFTQVAEERFSSLHDSISLFCSMKRIAFFSSFSVSRVRGGGIPGICVAGQPNNPGSDTPRWRREAAGTQKGHWSQRALPLLPEPAQPHFCPFSLWWMERVPGKKRS